MNKKKRFFLKAVVLILLIIITPVANGTISNSANPDNQNNEIAQNIQKKWDLKITLSEISFQRYDQIEDFAYYKIRYKIENIGSNTYIGFPMTVLRVHNEKWEISSWKWQGIFPMVIMLKGAKPQPKQPMRNLNKKAWVIVWALLNKKAAIENPAVINKKILLTVTTCVNGEHSRAINP